MIRFTTILLQFGEQGEKTGWTYLNISASQSAALNPGCRKIFRVKGLLDDYVLQQVAVFPTGEGGFMMPVNAVMRKDIKKQKGAKVTVQLEVDHSKLAITPELLECLADEPTALAFFQSLSPSHQGYFSKWIESAKTEPTKTKRIAQAINGLGKGWSYGELLRSLSEKRREM